MVKNIVLALIAAVLVCSSPAQASEKRDLYPGTENWHRYRFYVTSGTSAVAVRQNVTMLWDNTAAGTLLALYDTTDAASPDLIALSAGNDRAVSLDVGLLDGTYQLIIVGVVAPTHYHLNVIYSQNELIFQQPNGPFVGAGDEFSDRLIAEDLAPRLARLAAAMN
jgi:hypothetical protein